MVAVTATPDPTTGSMLIQVEQTIGRDLFTRVVAGGWGNLTTGQAWANTGGAAGDYSVTGTLGQVSNGTLNVARITTYDTLSTDHDTTYTWITPAAVPTGTGPFSDGALARYTDASNYYFAHVDVNVGNTVTLRIRKRVLGANSNISDTVTLPVTHAGNNQYLIRIAVCGPSIKAKAWVSTVTEPDWMLSATDFDLTTGTRTGQRSILDPGVTNGLPVVWQFDNLVTIVSQPFRLYRVVGGEYTEVLGSPSNSNAQTAAANSATATFWDNVGPFGVSTTYVLRSNCNTLDVATSAPVTLTSDFGWLRDPFNPTANVPITEAGMYDQCDIEDVVVFSGLGSPVYANSSGQFDIIDNPRPTTVSQVRKNYASSLALTSFSLDDILSLEDIFAPGTILALSLPTEYGWAMRTFGTDFITIGDVEQSYIGRDQRVTVRFWTMPFRLSDEPPDPTEGGTGGNGIGGGGATYDDLAASALGTTYNTLTASGQTYDQVAAGVGY
jgi:hypothetical protein